MTHSTMSERSTSELCPAHLNLTKTSQINFRNDNYLKMHSYFLRHVSALLLILFNVVFEISNRLLGLLELSARILVAISFSS